MSSECGLDSDRSGRFHWQALVNAVMHIRVPQDVASQEGLWSLQLVGVREVTSSCV